MNALDLIRFFATAFYIILYLFSIEYSELTWAMVSINLLRVFTGFRAFSKTRYFIRLLIMCISKMKDFLLIFIYATLSIGFMNSISTHQENLDYQSIWSSSFGIVVGNTYSFY